MAAAIGATLVAACGGSSDVPASPTAFQAVFPALPLTFAPRVAASADDSTWAVWGEGDNNAQSLFAARINGVGVVTRSALPSNAAAVRDVQITTIGATPVVTWLAYGQAAT